jgi:hemoglobin
MNTMHRILITLLLATCSTLQVPAVAQDAASGDALYKALGEKPGITRIVDGFVNRMASDVRISAMFKNTKLPNLKEQLRDQFCVVSGGPCKYEGDTMKASHADLGINKANFNTAVELLQLAMDDQRVPFSEQNKLLALLAPMHRDIITR